jgi:plastocyanin
MPKRLQSLAIVLLLLGIAGCGGGGGGSSSTPTSPTTPTPSNIVTIQVLDFEFEPKSVTINAGEIVRWVFDGQDMTHTSTSKDDMTWDSQFVFQQVGDAFQWTSSAADDGQTFEYRCRTHDNSHDMKGSIRVGANAPAPSPGY